MGYCRDERPRSVYWAMRLVREYLTVQGQVGFNGKVPNDELWKDTGHKGLVRLFEEVWSAIRKFGLPLGATLQTILLIRINIMRE